MDKLSPLWKRANEESFKVPEAVGGEGERSVRLSLVKDLLERAEALVSDAAWDESELNRNYQLGISSGLEQAAKFLLERAAKNFKANHDETAKVLRALHHELLTQSCKERPDDEETS
jgi:hypothetical protein